MKTIKRPIIYHRRTLRRPPSQFTPTTPNPNTQKPRGLFSNRWGKYKLLLRVVFGAILSRLHFANVDSWKRKLRSYTRRQAYVTLASVIFLSTASPVLIALITHQQSLANAKHYHLSTTSQQLLGSLNKDLVSKITHDESKKLYQYNKEAIPAKDPSKNLASPPGQSQQLGGGADKYSVDLAEDPNKGVTIHDTSSELSFSLIPQFQTMNGKQQAGRLVYPLQHINNKSTEGQLIYTVKANGLKEDIILPTAQTDSLDLSYKLQLPDTLQAKLNTDGAIGIYSADPTLFGNISYGSDQDQQKVEAARKQSDKTHLVFMIPAPVIKQTGSKPSNKSKAVFELKNNLLTVKATNLKQASYPLSIDPSVVVTSATDFTKGNQEGNIEFDTSNDQIKRGGLSGGTVPSWTTDSSTFAVGRYGHSSVTYNGYLYVLGGSDANLSTTNSVQYAKLTAGGALASDAGCGTAWCATNALPTNRYYQSTTTYNGYMYVIGSTGSADVQYAKFTGSGALAADAGCGTAWCATTSLAGAIRFGHASAAYNGNIYVAGGCASLDIFGNCTSYMNDVQYAPINANGTIGAWTTTTSFATGRSWITGSIYNGYLYVLGGYDGSAYKNDVQYAPINANGTIGTWTTTTSFATGRYLQTTVATAGYIYVMGGYNGGALQDVQYAPINANGSLGVWAASTNLASARYAQAAATANGYIYLTGGQGYNNDTQYAKIDPAGVTGSYTSTTALTTGLFRHASVAYNGYLYVIGGCSAEVLGACSTFHADTRYAKFNADGTLAANAGCGSGWCDSGNNFATARESHTAVAYNGYMYIMGGFSGALQKDIQYAAINSNGTLGAWASAGVDFTTARKNHTSVVANGYIYVIGGISTPAQNDIQYTQIGSTGTTGAWTTDSSTFTNARYGHTSVAIGGYVYVIGGYDGSTFFNTTQYAKFGTSGALSSDAGCGSAWCSTSSFTTGRYLHTTVFRNGYLYLSGGEASGPSDQSDVQYAQINTNGSLGAWTATVSFANARYSQTSVTYQGYMYVIGGYRGGDVGIQSDVQYAQVNNGGKGTVSSWSTNSTSFTTTRSQQASVAYNGYLYVIGGYNGGPLADVQYAPINSNGTIGTWAGVTSMSAGRRGHTAVISGGYLYVIGGLAGSFTNDVLSIPVLANGTLGASWTTSGTTFTTARYLHTSVVNNGYIYVMGGCSADGGFGCTSFLSDVQYASINNGVVGSWSSTTGFTTARKQHSSVTANGYVYVLGGCTSENISGCQGFLNDVQYAKFGGSGALLADAGCGSAWCTANSFLTPRQAHTSAASNGYLYIYGGYPNGASLSDVQYAPINTNGTIGNWSTTTGLPAGRYAHSMAVYNGYVYIIGGCPTSCQSNDIIIAGQEAIPRVARYSYLFDSSGDSQATKLYYRGTVNGGSQLPISYKAAPTSTSVFGSSTSVLELASNVLKTLNTSENRYYQLTFTLDDSQSAVFPDATGTPATMADFELFYHPATTKRLRGGKTFTGQTQQSLDAQP